MEVTRKFLEQHMAVLRKEQEAALAQIHQLNGAIAMATLALQRLDALEPQKEEEDVHDQGIR